MSEPLTKFDWIRKKIEEKYGDEVKVSFNEKDIPQRRYATSEIAEVLELVSELEPGQNVKLRFESHKATRTNVAHFRYYLKKNDVKGVKVRQQWEDMYLIRTEE